MASELIMRPAQLADVAAIVQLVNQAYRPAAGVQGWTHEAALVAGERTSAEQVAQLLDRPDCALLLGCTASAVVACVLVEREADGRCMIGMLAVAPQLQAAGLGKQMLSHAEHYAQSEFGASKLCMVVLSARSELLAFYLRRGYRRSGEMLAYPLEAGVGTPKHADLTIEVLEKTAASAAVPLSSRH